MPTKNRPVVLISSEGNIKHLSYDRRIPLSDLQDFVNGYIEILKVKYDGILQHMIVNEEGLLYNLPVNKTASELANRIIVGNVAIVRYLT